MARLEPMAFTSSVGLVQGHVSRPTHVARCFRGRLCPYRLHGRCWFCHDDDPEEDPPCRVDAATASLGLPGRVRRLERIVEQIGAVLVPLASKGHVDGLVGEQKPIVEGPLLVPRERVQNCTTEQGMDVPVPQIMEERVHNLFAEQTVGSPVPQITEEIVDRVAEQTVGSPVPQITEEIVDRVAELTVGSPVPLCSATRSTISSVI